MHWQSQCHAAVVLLIALVAWTGCSPAVRWPNLYHPGPAAYQRAEAVVHDPYPLNDVGPEIVGGRPRGYQVPLSEVERSRIFSQRRATAPLSIPWLSTPPPAPQPIAAPYSTPAAVPPPYALPAQPVPAPYSSPTPVAPAAPYQYTPATPLEAFPSRSPY